MNKNEVNTAFEILLEEIEKVFNTISKEGEEAFKLKDFDKARSLTEYGKKLKTFREKVKTLQEEWQNLFDKNIPAQIKKIETKGKLKKGLRTPEKAYYIPILESIIELGGSAEVEDVLKLVHNKMKDILNEYDYETLRFGEIRWENAAKWARYTMVEKGLLSNNSNRGIWEITEKGRKYLEIAVKTKNKCLPISKKLNKKWKI